LKGHIALSNARFPTDTTGAQLDPLARQFLWRYSCDYNHSTGHGIGYCLNVHEGPGAISKNNNIPLQAGMIFSNEPGYYKENQFGIRLENMMLVKKETNGFLSFETISLVPFDSKFINDDLLDTSEISWLKTYNHQIISSLDLKNDISAWLASYLNPFL
jgi:Xaa-Pro aminopeptidase